MGQLRNIYRFVNLVGVKGDELEKEFPSMMTVSGYSRCNPATWVVKQDYAKKYGATSFEVHDACADGIKFGYLEGYVDEKNGIKVDIICLTTKGRTLLDKIWVIPIGRFEATLTAFKASTTFLFGIISSGTIYLLIKGGVLLFALSHKK
jgi:hypothetical protein